MPKKASGDFNKTAYDMDYAKQHIRRRMIPFNMDKPEDFELWEWLDGRDNITQYIKDLIRADMK